MATLLRRSDESYHEYITGLDEMALAVSFSPERIASYQHEMDNSFINWSYGLTVHNLRRLGYQILGTGASPWVHLGQEMAVVFEDCETFEKFWCHISMPIFRAWLRQTELEPVI